MKLREAAKFCDRFGTALRAGLDVVNVIESECHQGPGSQQAAMRRLQKRVQEGYEVGDAMQADPFFPPVLSALMKAGDESGKVDQALLILSEHYDHRVKARGRFIAKLIYPSLMLCGTVFVLSVLIYLMGIFPQMDDILGFGMRGGSGVLKLWAIFGVIFAFIGTSVFLFRRNFMGMQNLVPILYAIPKVGSALQTITLSYFCNAMTLSFESGLTPFKSIRLATGATGSEYYRQSAEPAELAIRKGADLASALRATHIYPEELLQNISLAEQSGTLAQSFHRLSRDYNERAERALFVLSTVTTAMIGLIVGGFVLFLIIRLLMKIIQTYQEALQPI
ncbi:MAG: type II secretion system F family protein [Planctomycetota bacterium]